MPLICLSGDYVVGDEGVQPVIVFSDEDRNMGILVKEIVDIVEQQIVIDLSGQRPGYLGSAIISEKATDIVDVAHYLAQAFQSWFDSESNQSFGLERERHILLVDDSPFFRNLLTPVLSVAGYTVTAVSNPSEALKLHESGSDFDAIVSDIEMPGMNGFEFAAAINREGLLTALHNTFNAETEESP
jgi:two-component system chemotaxis sensor kinase CheA